MTGRGAAVRVLDRPWLDLTPPSRAKVRVLGRQGVWVRCGQLECDALANQKCITSYEYICTIWRSEPERFILNPIHQMPGLNS
jgi:hypothetical protein